MRIGIDLGGSKVAGVVLNHNEVLLEQRQATPQDDYQATVQAVADMVQSLEQTLQTQDLPVGIGHPGSLNPRNGLLRNANSTCLNGRPLKHDLQAVLGREVAMDNDANCLALSEAHDGAAQAAESAFCVILGTGVGGALVQQGHTRLGYNALAGEWGHNPLPWKESQDGPVRDCWCGRQDCIERWLSGPALAHSHQLWSGQDLSAEQIALAAQTGDAAARQSLQTYADQLARALAAVINFFDPQTIVLAGGLSQIGSLYDDVPRLWQRWVFAEQVRTELVPARHGDASGVLGAARLGRIN